MAESIIIADIWYFYIPPLFEESLFYDFFSWLLSLWHLSRMADAAAAHDNNSVISIYSELLWQLSIVITIILNYVFQTVNVTF